jgi:hypothetical protein
MAGIFGTLGDLVYGITAEDKTKAGVDSASKGAAKLNASWGEVATTGLGVAGIAAGVGMALWAAADRSADYADHLQDLSKTTGLTVERLQELRFIAGQTGGDFEAIASSVQMMTKNLGNMTPDTAAALEDLGIKVYDAEGKMLPMATLLPQIIENLGKIEDPTKRAADASAIFGRNYKEIADLIGLTADNFNQLAINAHNAGAVLSDEDVAAMADFKKESALVNLEIEQFWMLLGKEAMPLLKELPTVLEEIRPGIEAIAWVIRNATAFGHLFKAGEALATGNVEGAQAEFAKGQAISQGTTGKGGPTSITIQGNVNLAKGDTISDWIDRENTTQAGVNLLQ